MTVDTKLKYSILFVEDEDEIREKYVRNLKRYFENVYEASNGRDGYKLYKEKKPHILIIDINLPIMNGLEMLSIIREHDHTTKALLLTANSDKNYLLEASELKLTKYLLKPVSREDLKQALNLAIDELQSYNITSNKLIQLKDGFVWNYGTNELYNENSIVKISSIEKKILILLFSNINSTFSNSDLIANTWDDLDNDKTFALKHVIKRLRSKLPKDILINIYNEGYKIVV